MKGIIRVGRAIAWLNIAGACIALCCGLSAVWVAVPLFCGFALMTWMDLEDR